MSYGEELMLRMLIDEYKTLDEIRQQETQRDRFRLYGALGARTWIMADETTIPIARMEDSHIRNCMAMLRRNLPFYGTTLQRVATRYLSLFQEELEQRHSKGE